MSRLLPPTLAVLLLAGIIGCGGGGGTPSFGDDTTSSAGSDAGSDGGSDGGSVTDLRAPAGDYTATYSVNDGAGTVTGSGTATALSDGTLDLSFAAGASTSARVVHAVVAASGAVTSGTVAVGSASAIALTSGTLAAGSGGTYVLKATFTNASSVAQTDTYTLSVLNVGFSVASSGTDNKGGRYAGSGSATLGSGNVLSLSYVSTRSPSGTSYPSQTLSTTLLSGGTFSGTLFLGTTPASATGTWSKSSTGLKLVLRYVNEGFVTTTGKPTVTETLTLTKG